MNWHAALGILSGIIAAGATIPYIREMLHGTTRPNLVSWSLWVLLQSIVVAAQFKSGASWSVVLPIAGVVTCLAVVVLGLNGYGYKQYTLFDWGCLACAIAAIILWMLTNDPLVAIGLSILADLLATMPTIIKTLKDPHSESASAFFLSGVAAIFSVLSIVHFNLSNVVWPAYIILANSIVVLFIFFGKRSRPHNL